jgi:hypothetical protein
MHSAIKKPILIEEILGLIDGEEENVESDDEPPLSGLISLNESILGQSLNVSGYSGMDEHGGSPGKRTINHSATTGLKRKNFEEHLRRVITISPHLSALGQKAGPKKP